MQYKCLIKFRVILFHRCVRGTADDFVQSDVKCHRGSSFSLCSSMIQHIVILNNNVTMYGT